MFVYKMQIVISKPYNLTSSIVYCITCKLQNIYWTSIFVMNFEKLTLELDKLNLLQPGSEGGGGDEETWLFDPVEGNTDKPTAEKNAEEEQNLEKWLKGAVDKVDYRTRSALTRRLEKKRRKADKEKRLKRDMESSLSMIEEASSESGPLSDREQRMRPREKDTMAQRKAISEASVCSEDEEEEEEEYFDAPSTPKKMPQLATGSYVRSPMKAQSPAKTRIGTKLGVTQSTVVRHNVDRNSSKSTPLKKERGDLDLSDLPKTMEWKNLSDIERRAKEQERELQNELMRNRRDRLSANATAATPRSRPDSASSSTSSVLSGGNGNAPAVQQQPLLINSKSVDFRDSSGHIADQSSVASSRSNEGSLADLSGISEGQPQPLNSRLPLPRRPTIPGKTGIPLPASRKASRMATTMEKCHSPPSSINDEDCF